VKKSSVSPSDPKPSLINKLSVWGSLLLDGIRFRKGDLRKGTKGGVGYHYIWVLKRVILFSEVGLWNLVCGFIEVRAAY
jgi:hypothetical protein